jgi:hypothetical protein
VSPSCLGLLAQPYNIIPQKTSGLQQQDCDTLKSSINLLPLIKCTSVFPTLKVTKKVQKTILTTESFIYPNDAELDCSKKVKIYMRGVPTCFGFSQPSPGSYYVSFVKVISINNQLKYVVYRIRSV